MRWPNPLNLLAAALTLAAAAGLVGCSAYDSRYQFTPKPAEVVVYPENAAAPGAPGVLGVRTLVSVLGLRNPPLGSSQPPVIELAMRIENQTDKPVIFEQANLELVSGDLRDFARPMLSVPDSGPITIDSLQTWSATAQFEFPPGVGKDDLNLDGLNLKWALIIDGKFVTRSVGFTRRIVRGYYYESGWHSEPYFYYYGPYYGYPYYDRYHHGHWRRH
jgi:hypothetical protein